MAINYQNWLYKIQEDLDKGLEIDEIPTYNKSAQALIKLLSVRNIPFKLYNLGAGIKRITTNTNICPCCKRKL